MEKKNQRSQKQQRPTHFLSLRIDDQVIVSAIATAQSQMTARCPSVAEYLILPSKFHLTLAVMAISDKASLELAISALASAMPIVRKHFPASPPTISFRGVGIFNFGRVLFIRPSAECSDAPRVAALASDLRLHFISKLPPGVLDANAKDDAEGVYLHCTIAKVSSRGGGRSRRRMGAIPTMAYNTMSEIAFGNQLFTSIELVEMQAIDPDQFYHRIVALPFPGVSQAIALKLNPPPICPQPLPPPPSPPPETTEQSIEVITSVPTLPPLHVGANAPGVGVGILRTRRLASAWRWIVSWLVPDVIARSRVWMRFVIFSGAFWHWILKFKKILQ